MRICLISREFPPDTGWGGIATFVHDLALGLVEIGHEVEVIALAADEKDSCIDYNGVTVRRVAWKALLADKQRMLTLVPYCHNIARQIIALWQCFARQHEQRPFDVVEAPEMFAEGLFVSVSKAAPLVIRLYTPHFKFIDEGFHNVNGHFDHQFIAMLERLTMLSADLVTSPSEDLADYICCDMNYPRARVPIVRDPVDTGKFRPDGPQAMSKDGKVNVLFAGRLEARKGVYQLVEAIPRVVKSFPQVRFVFVGRDTNTAPGNKSVQKQLEARLKRAGVRDKVLFVPPVPNAEMPAYFRSADICVLPSLYDNAPFTCIEALSSGKPVIGTTAGGMKEYIMDGLSGLIVPPGDARALASALLELLTDEEKRLRFGRNARKHVLANFDRKEIARQSVDLYKLAQANFKENKLFPLYRHGATRLTADTDGVVAAFDKMLYDLLYACSWRFRLKHWFHMLKDRPKLTLAKVLARIGRLQCKITGHNWDAIEKLELPSRLEDNLLRLPSAAKPTAGIASAQRASARTVSTALAAIVIFLAVNGCLKIWHKACIQLDATSLVEHKLKRHFIEQTAAAYAQKLHVWDDGSISTTLDEYGKLEQSPGVLLIGSSVMLFPMAQADRSMGLTRLPTFYYHFAKVLGKAISTNSMRSISTFNFATPLQMASDANFFLQQRILRKPPPKLIIYGVTARDFYDANYPDTLNTLNIRVGAEVADLPFLVSTSNCDFDKGLNFCLNKWFYLMDNRSLLADRLRHEAARLLLRAHRTLKIDSRIAVHTLSPYDYRKHYLDVTSEKFDQQLSYLAKFVDTCKQQHTKVIVVNLTSPVELIFIPVDAYKHFLCKLDSVCRKGDCQMIDLSKAFGHGDYLDSFHLNSQGGKKLINYLLPAIRLALGSENRN